MVNTVPTVKQAWDQWDTRDIRLPSFKPDRKPELRP